MEKRKVLEVVETSKWIDGSGFSYTESCYSSQFLYLTDREIESYKKEVDWDDYWEVNEESERKENEDLLIGVKYYLIDEEGDQLLIVEHEIWESELIK